MATLPGESDMLINSESMITTNRHLIFFLNTVNVITHMLLGIIALSTVFFLNVFPGSVTMRQHIYLCVVGYIILMSEAILSLSPHTGWSKSLNFQHKKMTHLVMQVVGSVLALTGSIIRISALNNHFESAHGILGIIAMVLTFISLIGGVFNMFLNSRINVKAIRIGHSMLGSLTVIIAFICLVFGFHNVYRNIMGNVNADLSIAFTVIALIGVLTSPCIGVYRRATN